MSHNFNRTILREYDVRGIVDQTLSTDDAYALGRSYAALAVSEGARRVAIGRDGRTHSPEMEAALIRGVTEGGLNVVRIGMGPSPMLYFAVATLDVQGGIQVTGSHNPANYNGFKLLLNGRSVFGAEIQDLGRRAAEGDWSEGHGTVEDTDVVDAYVEALVKDFDGVWSRFDDTVGMSRLRVMHLNDSKTPFASRRDRHELIGEGSLGEEPFRRIMTDPRFDRVPKVLETPKLDDATATDTRMMARLRSYRG